MRPPSYYTSLANSNSSASSRSPLYYNSSGTTSSNQHLLRTGLSSSSSSAYVTRSHLPYVSQSMLVAHCITGSGSSTKPYGQTSSSLSSSSSSTSRISHLLPSSSYSTSYTTSRSPSTKLSYSSRSPAYLSSTSRTGNSSSSSYLRPSSAASNNSSSSSSSYYKPIRLRERPLLTQISQIRQLSSESKHQQSPSSTTTTTTTTANARRAVEDHSAKTQESALSAQVEVKVEQSTESAKQEDWSSDVARNISRNKYLIKFREKDQPKATASPVELPVKVELEQATAATPAEAEPQEMRLPLVVSQLVEAELTTCKAADCDTTETTTIAATTTTEKKKVPKAKKNIKLKIKTLNSSGQSNSTASAASETVTTTTGEQVTGKTLDEPSPTTPKATKVKRLVKTSKGKGAESKENAQHDAAAIPSATKPKGTKKATKQEPIASSLPPTSPPTPPQIVDLQKAALKESSAQSPGSAPVVSKRIRFREYNFNDFNFLTVLGHGGWGFVILAELKQHDAYFAVKCIKKITIVEDDDFDSIMIERKMLTLGNVHPFICKLFCTFETDGYLFFVMEYCAGGDLMFHVQKEGKFSESRCRFYAAEIICAIRFLHNRHIIYRDLKLDNILLDAKGHIRLVDFGMCQCRTYREEMLPSNFCGTPEYISPEIIKGVPYNHSVDWWSFGVLLYEMAVGKMPFRGSDENELLWNVCYEQIHYPMFLTKELTSLLQLLLEREPAKRMGMATCKAGDIYDQRWFRGVDWKAMETMKVEPPFVPEVNSKRDVQNFDADFTESTPELSPVDATTLQRIDQSQFQKFPYTNPDIFNFD